MARRGTLRIYLGAAPGVGKTYAMLSEAHRRAERGTDIVVGFVETHDRPRTEALLRGLETVPRRPPPGAGRGEMDTEAVLRRAPAVACVDELAHSNAPGSRHDKRWRDIDTLLDAGIDVISTVNIQHLESLADVVAAITGVRQRETVPDAVVRRADQIELVDMTPEALRRRMAHGNIYTPDKVDAALSHYFRPGNLTALRELALLWTADRVDAYLQRYRTEQGIRSTWYARERIVVALTGGPEGSTLIRRAARMAAKSSGGEILAVHVSRADRLTAVSPRELASQRTLVEQLGGTFHHVIGDDISSALLDFARGVNANQIVLGSSRRKTWQYAFGPGVGASVARDSGPDLDVHIVTHAEVARGRGLPNARGARLGRSRTVAGWLIGLAGPPLLTVLLAAPPRPLAEFASDVLLFLSVTVLAALVGGFYPGLVSAALATLLLDYFFTEPLREWGVGSGHDVITVVIFFAIALAVASVVDMSAQRTQQAARLRAESETLTVLAGSVLRGEDTLRALLGRARETFGMDCAALLERDHDGGRWRCVGSVSAIADNPRPLLRPQDADVDVPVGEHTMLVLSGRVLPAEDRRVLSAFAAQAATILDRQRLLTEAARAHKLAEGNRIRTALLAAVSHDLRTPLAAIKASVSSLRSDDVEWSPQDRAGLLESIEDGADRLDQLVGNLLDMSRLHTGTVRPLIRRTGLDEVVLRALAGVPVDVVDLDVPESLPWVAADPGLLERSVANIVENAVKYRPPDTRVLVRGSALGNQVELRVVDRGPGVPDADKGRIFEPFQRHGDIPRGNGVGLGLAVARGFTEAMGGTLDAEDTPGGGMTMVLTLPTDIPAPAAAGAGTPAERESEQGEQGGAHAPGTRGR
ncbi:MULTISPECIES: ATP-binding protein [Streptomyces]|jgi:two-component system sensor histidine kinase KdpD|uniref:ATP-binding protein n=1 Tax=Streptomyces TaxID=1883 RepID=UPI001907B64B|nr:MULTISPECIES: ATP-binding protein [unclassified Streptomyces]MCU4746546.1 DUF4118 domain-containing protein [Streptomyces sp. G-5]QQN76811.1 sensor histidine kinase KdpD [Streptomyces sp. XC 2026]